MKKLAYALAVIVTSIGVVLFFWIFFSTKSHELFMSNVEALNQGEAGLTVCTGPKKENLSGNIFCHCENASPCKDNQGCQ